MENIIFSYSRKQAIEDGVLVDLNAVAPEECELYKYPVACTAAVWDIIDKAVKNPRWSNDIKGVMWDIMYMSTAMSKVVDESTKLFQVIIKGAGRKSTYTFKMVCGPGDDAKPVITIMLPNED